ncbi:MAG: alpha/beta fold hydrolase [Boseongicola sp.]|nr:MAG: alpha/beta fold hydrolase [Boseongicola sp.]
MKQIEINGRQLAYRKGGDGETIIALHCSSSHSGQWKPLISALEQNARVIAPDMHGYGRSESFVVDGRPWFEHDAEYVLTLIEQSDRPVHLVGHSLGAALACFVTRSRPEAVASLTMIEPVLFALLEEAEAPEVKDAWWISSTLHGLLRVGRQEEAAETFVDFWAGSGSWDATEDHVKAYVIQTIGRVADDWAGMAQLLEGQVRLADIASLKMPVLMMRGTETRASASRIVDLMLERLPDGRLVEFSGLGHMAAVTHPDIVMPEIIGWLDGHLKQS